MVDGLQRHVGQADGLDPAQRAQLGVGITERLNTMMRHKALRSMRWPQHMAQPIQAQLLP